METPILRLTSSPPWDKREGLFRAPGGFRVFARRGPLSLLQSARVHRTIRAALTEAKAIDAARTGMGGAA